MQRNNRHLAHKPPLGSEHWIKSHVLPFAVLANLFRCMYSGLELDVWYSVPDIQSLKLKRISSPAPCVCLCPQASGKQYLSVLLGSCFCPEAVPLRLRLPYPTENKLELEHSLRRRRHGRTKESLAAAHVVLSPAILFPGPSLRRSSLQQPLTLNPETGG